MSSSSSSASALALASLTFLAMQIAVHIACYALDRRTPFTLSERSSEGRRGVLFSCQCRFGHMRLNQIQKRCIWRNAGTYRN
ncbi:hypothetical protein F5146DRAFT_1018152 [Armillaria mellea]|nr:hypothetical protein F5146DRAFT_1018152 [Armillaria mellea]